ncbi:MAG: glycine cleavage system protein GcvH [Thermoplasmata archaeon]|nr:glycine cleavage system protein GcvH [Candidatus Sysuiplasma acidicola]MBX8646032.1 glycine cleavage system protein GcvH [Candidatus Sysuiplasma acidicola]MDH2905347.1 glycine cleavage system protein GcvH [Methanomassiliicoccales archaeon]
MSTVPEDLYYTKTHEWVRKEKEGYRIGITDHAQSELTDVVYVEFEKPGKNVKTGDVVASVESVKTVSEIYAPVDGTIISVNEAVAKKPERINQDPYGEGWFIVLRPASGGEGLLSAPDYRKAIGE